MATIEARPINTYTKDQGDIFDNSYYDTAILAANQLNYNMFQTPLSNTVNKGVTNMTDAGQLSNGKQFQVQQVGVRFTYRASTIAVNTGDSLADLFSTFCKALITFNVVGKQDLGQWPGAEFLGVTSLAVQDATTLFNTTGVNNLIPAWKRLRYPINLNELVKFGVNLSFSGITAIPINAVDFAVQIILRGIEQRRK